MQIDIISDKSSWIADYLPGFIQQLEQNGAKVRLFHEVSELEQGDLLFILSCGRLLKPEHMALHQHNLVVHESALPQGRGWSPLTWQILEGKSEVSITLFECAEAVDSGVIYLQNIQHFSGDELVDELRVAQAEASFQLCLDFVKSYPEILSSASEQTGEATYYKRRRPVDSRLDPELTIAEQFNLLRTVDNERYPAYFEYRGQKYYIRIEKASDDKK